jgi:hypothetical protein
MPGGYFKGALMIRRHLRVLLASLAAVVLVLAGCGNDDSGGAQSFDDPEEAILAAFNAIDTDSAEMTFSYDGTADDLLATLAILDEDFSADEPGADAMIALMAGAELRVAANDEDFEMELLVDGTSLMEMRFIGETFYLRLDVDAGIDLIREIDAEAASEVEMMTAFVPFITMEDPRLSFVADLFAGSWISMEVPADSEFGDLLEPQGGADTIDEEVFALIAEIIESNTNITHLGQARGGEHFVVEVDVATTVASIAGNPRAAQALDLTDVATDPDEIIEEMRSEGVASTWEFDVVITNGVVSSIRMDLATLSTDAPAGASLPFLIELSASPSAPSAPSDHTPIPMDLLEEMSSGMGGVGGMGF